LVCQIMSPIPDKTEDSTQNAIHGNLHPVNLSSITHGYGVTLELKIPPKGSTRGHTLLYSLGEKHSRAHQ